MISIEQWRGRIGSFYREKVHGIVSHTKATPFTSSALFLSLIQAMMSAAVISILLIIGGVESNPGPPVVTPKGEFLTDCYNRYLYMLIKLCYKTINFNS